MLKVLTAVSLLSTVLSAQAQSLPHLKPQVQIPQGPGYGFHVANGGVIDPASSAQVVPQCNGCGHGGPGRTKGQPLPPAVTLTPPAVIPPVGPNQQTAAQIYGSFAQTLIANLAANPTVNTQFAAAGPYEVAFLSTEMYRNGSSSQVAQLLTLLSQRLNGPNLALVRASFGRNVDAYVRAYASAAVQSSYFSQPLVLQGSIQPQSAADYQSLGLGEWIPPTWDMTVNDIWWEEFVKAGATVQSAITATTLRVGGNGVAAFQAGYWIGTQIYIFLDYLDPNINIEIGNTVGSFVDGVVTQFTDDTATAYVDLPGFYDLVDGANFTENLSWYLWGSD